MRLIDADHLKNVYQTAVPSHTIDGTKMYSEWDLVAWIEKEAKCDPCYKNSKVESLEREARDTSTPCSTAWVDTINGDKVLVVVTAVALEDSDGVD